MYSKISHDNDYDDETLCMTFLSREHIFFKGQNKVYTKT